MIKLLFGIIGMGFYVTALIAFVVVFLLCMTILCIVQIADVIKDNNRKRHIRKMEKMRLREEAKKQEQKTEKKKAIKIQVET